MGHRLVSRQISVGCFHGFLTEVLQLLGGDSGLKVVIPNVQSLCIAVSENNWRRCLTFHIYLLNMRSLLSLLCLLREGRGVGRYIQYICMYVLYKLR